MAETEIRFVDGATYDQGMGSWSRLVGEIFLDWLAPPQRWRWLDVGCGSGVVTELLMQRCAPADVQGIDPSEAQLAFARNRPGARGAVLQQGDAMALPFGDDRFDAAVMALVLFFVRDPAKGVAEMVRVVRPGGMVAAYAWDVHNGGSPFSPIQTELRAMGVAQPVPPGSGVERVDALRDLWTGLGLQAVEMREITAQRSFPDFDAFWAARTEDGSRWSRDRCHGGGGRCAIAAARARAGGARCRAGCTHVPRQCDQRTRAGLSACCAAA